MVAALARQLGDLDLAEDALAAALVAAVERWPAGVPDDPVAWLHVVARNHALDVLRARRRTSGTDVAERVAATDGSGRAGHVAATDGTGRAGHMAATDGPGRPGHVAAAGGIDDGSGPPDDRLALVLACCHPALAAEARVALTLRHVTGLTTAEVARAFLTSEAAMAQRLVRARRKLRVAGAGFDVPAPEHVAARLASALTTIYLVFTEGHAATAGAALVRHELCAEAIDLARLVVALAPQEPEARGLLALLLLTHARRDTRVDAEGRLVLLADQDRGRWDRTAIAEGLALLPAAGEGRFALQARIAAEHARATTAPATDWAAIAALYVRLGRLDPSPVVRLNGAVAVAEASGPAAGLAAAERAGRLGALDAYGPFHVTRAALLERLDRHAEARAAYERAIGLAANDVERAHLEARLAALGDPGAA